MDNQRSIRGVRLALESIGLDGAPLSEEVVEIFRRCTEPIVAHEGAVEVVWWVAERYGVGVITNDDEIYQQAKLDHLGLPVRWLISSGAVGARKPERRIFAAALECAGVAPKQAVYVGDHPEIDVAGAMAAGLHAIWFNPLQDRYPSGLPPPAATIRSLRELAAVIDRLADGHEPRSG